MSFLLDSNAVSEPQQPGPDKGYLDWIRFQKGGDLYISALTLGELRRGVLRAQPGPRRLQLETWLSGALTFFADRILPVDARVGATWAEVTLRHWEAGRPAGAIDELIAATALAHDLTVVTRNVKHFRDSGCRLLRPWSDPASDA